MNKKTCRTHLLAQRKQLSPNSISHKSKYIIQHITRSHLWQQSKHIAIYLPFNGEVDLSPLLHTTNKHIYIPSIKGQNMQFHLYDEHLRIHQHKFGIKQPIYDDTLKQTELDLCLMPLLGFDLNGNRLGMGGGYYDRYFEDNQNTVLAGVAYRFQHIDKLFADSWDVKLHHIFTEQGHLIL